jgi:hypothetical protein
MINKNNYKVYIKTLLASGMPLDIILYIIHISLYGLNYSKLLKANKIEWKNRIHNLI